MKKIKNFSLMIFSALIFVCSAIVFTGCKDDDDCKLYVFSTIGGYVQVNDNTDYIQFGDEGSKVFTFKEDTSVNLKAIPENGYSFVKWEYANDLDNSRAELSTQPEITLLMDEDEIVVKAVFAVSGSATYTISYPANMEGYTINAESGYTTTVALGGEFKFKVNLLSNYSNSQITVKANNTILTPDANGVYTIPRVNSNTSITVEGVVVNAPVVSTTYTISTKDVGYTIQPIGTSSFVVNSGSSFTFTLQLHSGYKYSASGVVVKANGITLTPYTSGGTTQYTISSVNEDTEIRVTGIEQIVVKYTVTLSTSSKYTITQTNGASFGSTSVEVEKDQDFMFKVNIASGVQVESISVMANGVSVTNITPTIYSVRVTSDLVIAVNIVEAEQTLTYTFSLDLSEEDKALLGTTTSQIPSSISIAIKESAKQASYQASSFMVSTSMDANQISLSELVSRIDAFLIENSFDGMKYFAINGVKFIEFLDATDIVTINWNLLTSTGSNYPLIIVI